MEIRFVPEAFRVGSGVLLSKGAVPDCAAVTRELRLAVAVRNAVMLNETLSRELVVGVTL